MIKKEDIKYYDYPNPRWRRKDYKLLDKECDFYIYENQKIKYYFHFLMKP